MDRLRNNKVSPAGSRATIIVPLLNLPEDVKVPTAFETDVYALRKEKNDRKKLEAIRRMALPFSIKCGLRNKVVQGSTKTRGTISEWRYQQKLKWTKFKASVIEYRRKTEVWRTSFKEIEGNFGTGVVSYFTFLKWLLFLNIYIFTLVFWLIFVPSVAFTPTPYDVYVAGASAANGSTVTTDRADKCTGRYTININHQDAGQLILDALQGTGWMEKRELFYGYYEARRLYMFHQTGGALYYNMPLAYLLVTLITFVVSLVLMVRYTAKNMRENMMSSKDQHFKYSAVIFGGWDFSLENEKNSELKHKSLFNEMASEVEEELEEERRRKRKGWRKLGIYVVRVLINVLVVLILVACAALITYVTLETQTLVQRPDFSSFDPFLQLLIEFLPSITITSLSAIVPMFFNFIVKVEDYRRETQIKFTLVRTVFLKLASVMVLLVTLYTQVTCVVRRDDCNVGVTGSCPELKCWETYVGQQMYKLVVLDFIVVVATVLLVEFPRRLIVTKCPCNLAKKIGQQEMDIPKNVLDLVYGQVLCWLGFFFCPMIPAMCVMKLFITFYLKMFTVLKNYIPSSKPYRAARSNIFFMVILIVSYFGCCLPVAFAIWNVTPSHGCGPFRIYNNDLDIWHNVVTNFPGAYTTIVQILTSTTVFVITLLIIIMTLYYTQQRAEAYKDMVKIMKEQMILDAKEKQDFMRQIRVLQGAGAQSYRQRRIMSAKSARQGLSEKDVESDLVVDDVSDIRDEGTSQLEDQASTANDPVEEIHDSEEETKEQTSVNGDQVSKEQDENDEDQQTKDGNEPGEDQEEEELEDQEEDHDDQQTKDGEEPGEDQEEEELEDQKEDHEALTEQPQGHVIIVTEQAAMQHQSDDPKQFEQNNEEQHLREDPEVQEYENEDDHKERDQEGEVGPEGSAVKEQELIDQGSDDEQSPQETEAEQLVGEQAAEEGKTDQFDSEQSEHVQQEPVESISENGVIDENDIEEQVTQQSVEQQTKIEETANNAAEEQEIVQHDDQPKVAREAPEDSVVTDGGETPGHESISEEPKVNDEEKHNSDEVSREPDEAHNELKDQSEDHENQHQVTDTQNQESEHQNRETETQKQETEIQNHESDPQNPKTENQNQGTETVHQESEPHNRETETQNEQSETHKQESEPQNQETDTQNRETESQKQESDPENRETENKKAEAEQSSNQSEQQIEESEIQNQKAETDDQKA